jgi:mono/diheme cytochrome c family protein
MNMNRWVVIAAAAAGLASFGTVAHADGKATYTNICSECHETGDFEGENPKEVAATIKSIVAGTHKHKKQLKLTDQEINDVAAYLTSGGK